MSAVTIDEQTIFQPVVVKMLATKKLIIKELIKSTVAGMIQGNCLPVGVNENSLMLDKVQGVELGKVWGGFGYTEKRKLMKKLASILVETRLNFQAEGKELLEEFQASLGWASFLDENMKFLEADGQSLDINLKELQKMKDVLKKVTQTLDEEMTLVHGDLGLGNLILSGTELVLVDFEHVVEGPLALELAPAVFWNDENSLPVVMIKEELEKLGEVVVQEKLEQMLVVFVVNQLRLAGGSKQRNILKLARERGVL